MNRAVTLQPGQSILLDQAEQLWLVAEGDLDIVFSWFDGGRPDGPQRHACRLSAGALLVGASHDGVKFHALAAGPVSLLPLDWGMLEDEPLVEAVDAWVAGLSEGLAHWCSTPTQERRTADAPCSCPMEAGERFGPRSRTVWVEGHGEGCLLNEFALVPIRPAALGPRTWLRVPKACELRVRSTVELVAVPGWGETLRDWTAFALDALDQSQTVAQQAEQEWRDRRHRLTGERMEALFGRFRDVVHQGERAAPLLPEDEMLAACQLVGEANGMPVTAPPRPIGGGSAPDVADIAETSRFGCRKVRLQGQWWLYDSGPMVGRLAESGRPVALLPDASGRYRLHQRGETPQPVNATLAQSVAAEAHMFYPALPDRALTLRDLLALGWSRSRGDLAVVGLLGLAGSGLAALSPMLTAYLFNLVVPDHDLPLLVQLGLALALVAVAMFTVRVSGDFAASRMEGRAGALLQGAVIDRLLRLPMSHLAQMPVAALALQANSVETVRRSVGGLVTATATTVLFSLSSAVLLLVYQPVAAAVVFAVAALLYSIAWTAGFAMNKALSEGEKLSVNVYSLVFQLISNVAVLRALGGEARGFLRWGRLFAETRSRLARSQRIGAHFTSFVAGYDVLVTAALFLAIALARSETMPVGDFLGFVTAFGTFFAAVTQLARLRLQLWQIKPSIDLARPLLEARPETSPLSVDPGMLTGAVEIANVGFRYVPGMAPVLNGVSLSIRDGEYVGIVGASGSGKSTLVRLLLGLEKPQMGSIYYDGRNLDRLDVKAVRRQIGVVMQQTRVFAGSIYDNIAAGFPLTLDEAWLAAEKAGVAADIKAMPMGLHTVITEGAASLSGGQVQRLLIARALAGKPRMLLFDEATSALDDVSQDAVTAVLAGLPLTRVVVAHKFSTLRRCDRVVVLAQGSVVQKGGFEELLKTPGLFRDMALRQGLAQ